MATQGQISHHLATARRLLDDVTADDGADPQVKATAAAAHATLVSRSRSPPCDSSWRPRPCRAAAPLAPFRRS